MATKDLLHVVDGYGCAPEVQVCQLRVLGQRYTCDVYRWLSCTRCISGNAWGWGCCCCWPLLKSDAMQGQALDAAAACHCLYHCSHSWQPVQQQGVPHLKRHQMGAGCEESGADTSLNVCQGQHLQTAAQGQVERCCQHTRLCPSACMRQLEGLEGCVGCQVLQLDGCAGLTCCKLQCCQSTQRVICSSTFSVSCVSARLTLCRLPAAVIIRASNWESISGPLHRCRLNEVRLLS